MLPLRSSMTERVLILGAAGRDFHNFNVWFRGNAAYRVVAFTAAQIPNIAGRRYPPELAGSDYPSGIPIEAEDELERLINDLRVDLVVFSYSDVSHEHVMHLASRALAAGADYLLLGPRHTMLEASAPVVAVCAARTGAGKSQTTRRVAAILEGLHIHPVVVRHPMPYGDIARQAVQRFASLADLVRHRVTIEEREEYEPLLRAGRVVYAGVDYERILREAEREAGVLIWDGGNNDMPFFVPDLLIAVVDPHRADHAAHYHPGETVVRMADVIVVNKVDTASLAEIATARRVVGELNPTATVVEAASPIFVEGSAAIRGKRVLVVEDGPTVTHGGMPYGAGWVAAKRYGAAEIVDPRPHAVGSIRETYATYPTTGPVLPAMGYGEEQVRELAETIRRAPADLVVIGTPVDLAALADLGKPSVRVRYELQELGEPTLVQVLQQFVASLAEPTAPTRRPPGALRAESAPVAP
jgi:predicted GTPase